MGFQEWAGQQKDQVIGGWDFQPLPLAPPPAARGGGCWGAAAAHQQLQIQRFSLSF